FCAMLPPFGIFLPNAPPTYMRSALRGARPGGVSRMATTTQLNLLLSPRDAARALAVSPRTLWSLTSPRGPLPYVRIGRAARYDTAALQAFPETQKHSGRAG